MSDHNERACHKCGSLTHHEDRCPRYPSEGTAPEPVQTKVVAAVATGSLPVSVAEDFCGWLRHMTDLNLQLSEAAAKRGDERDRFKFRNYSSAFATAQIQLRRRMEDAIPRQPEENDASQQRAD